MLGLGQVWEFVVEKWNSAAKEEEGKILMASWYTDTYIYLYIYVAPWKSMQKL